jgi:hypothetical protein
VFRLARDGDRDETFVHTTGFRAVGRHIGWVADDGTSVSVSVERSARRTDLSR